MEKEVKLKAPLKKKRVNKGLSIASAVVTLLAQIAIGVFVFLSCKYYSISFATTLTALGIVLCILIIGDILFFVGYKYIEKKLQIVSIVIGSLLIIGSVFGSYYVAKINGVVNKVIDNSGTDQYELIGGTFVYYKESQSGKTFSDITDIADSMTVGVLYDDGVGTGTLAKKLLEDNNCKAEVMVFNTTDDLLSALVGEDNEHIDVAVFPTTYRQRLESDDEVDYSQYLDNIVDFYSFEEKVKTAENENSNRDLFSEPFNILLIGFAPEDEAMTYGLADTIIVATVNPQTFTVSMTSIARDSFVPISCYGGNRDKINAARGTSRACLMETVGNLLDIDIDYYMEVNFRGVVQIVDALGGITINNPVTFVGQTASGIRGEMTVLVPEGEYNATGEQALAFARERHAMPAGDFDRQQHQQEVIAAVAKELLDMETVGEALAVMNAAGDNMTTNLSLNQLTGIFNYLIGTKNNTGIDIFNMLDIQNMRVTGYSSWTYNYGMHLPLWIYKLYNGSIQEAKDRIDDVLNIYTDSDIEQDSYFKFFVEYPYQRSKLYHNHFDEAQDHEELPSFYPYLTKYTYEEAMAWAAQNGVNLQVTFIPEDSPNYVASEAGRVVDQNPRQGALVSEYPTGSITVMGSGDPNYVPTFTVENCNDASSCKAFAESKGIEVKYDYKYDDTKTEGEFAGTNYKNGDSIKKSDTLIIYTWKKQVLAPIPAISGDAMTYSESLKSAGFEPVLVPVTNGATKDNNNRVIGIVDQSGNPLTAGTNLALGSKITVNYYSYTEEKEPDPEDKPDEPTVTCREDEELVEGKCACKSGLKRGDDGTSCVEDKPADDEGKTES